MSQNYAFGRTEGLLAMHKAKLLNCVVRHTVRIQTRIEANVGVLGIASQLCSYKLCGHSLLYRNNRNHDVAYVCKRANKATSRILDIEHFIVVKMSDLLRDCLLGKNFF